MPACSEARRSSRVDLVGVVHKLFDGLADLSFVGTKKVDLAFDAEVVAGGDAGLGVLALTHEEGKLGVGVFDLLVVVPDERPMHSILVGTSPQMGLTYRTPAEAAELWQRMKRSSLTPLLRMLLVAMLVTRIRNFQLQLIINKISVN